MTNRHPARRYDQAAIRKPREGHDSTLYLMRGAHVDGAYLHPERCRHGLDGAELANSLGYARIAKKRRSRDARRDLFEEFQPLRAYPVFEREETGEVAARP